MGNPALTGDPRSPFLSSRDPLSSPPLESMQAEFRVEGFEVSEVTSREPPEGAGFIYNLAL